MRTATRILSDHWLTFWLYALAVCCLAVIGFDAFSDLTSSGNGNSSWQTPAADQEAS